ncbi:hypothetical protein T12_1120 [Trichinella patagoniensis]|uniref:Uncharacterized protein n=1 Tax=Trichinella patagoniensis TaxID=990121 RepID=A0A0V1AE64_9BILA|nr:hypothetical protein T12_1120 [Trichinella patagoniensis]
MPELLIRDRGMEFSPTFLTSTSKRTTLEQPPTSDSCNASLLLGVPSDESKQLSRHSALQLLAD